ncbi:MAG: F0F1 ATP synthase subunit epsilon [Dehalococcoidia bacterium]|nr:MAG: F0F1 ATP synthase subunit epsilon [Dehalococcoidia bacterium]
MPKLGFEIVTAERVVYSDEVDVVVAPGIEGQLAILPNHAPLMTMLQPGSLMVRKEGEEDSIFISGGFLEVQGNKVIVLADTAERAEEIDTARAEEARLRAEQRVAMPASEADHARAQAAMLRSLMRIKVAQRSRRKRPRG